MSYQLVNAKIWDGSAWVLAAGGTVAGFDMEYLVVAGGGGGGGSTNGNSCPAGGGAGGYRSSVISESSGGGASAETRLSFSTETSYLVTVGAGGAGGAPAVKGLNGFNSVFSNITSTAGGGGAANASGQLNGNAGGSGGGGAAFFGTGASGAGTTDQGFAGGIGTGTGGLAGGGGGASAAGKSDNDATNPGNGGNGVASSITGTSVTRAGGGAAALPTTTVGGLGGGGLRNSAGTVNTGGGGGGSTTGAASAGNGSGGAGGSGVVILKYPKAYLATFSAGVTQTTTIIGDYRVSQVTATSTTSETVSFSLSPTFLAEYLVVAGGGSGSSGGNYGGGGGAGGYLTDSSSAFTAIPYEILVGAGGSGGAGVQNDGNNSVFSTFIASKGLKGVGLVGGTSGNSFAGGTGSNGAPSTGGGGGGGSSSIGSNVAAGSVGGSGGAGSASSITGSSVTRAGGGGGAGNTAGGTGSAGGGNGGRVGSTNGTNATVNTGSGGGGAVNATSGSGGSGIVVIKYPSTYTATFSAGVTQTTSTVGDFKISQVTATSTTSETVTFAISEPYNFDTWTDMGVASSNTLNFRAGGGNQSGKYYMVGGYSGSSVGSMYDISTNTWTSTPLNRTTQETSVCGTSDGFYVIGGCRHNQTSHGDVSYVTNEGSASAVAGITSRHLTNTFRSDTHLWAFGGVTATCGVNYAANTTIMRATISGYSGWTQMGTLSTWSSPTAALGDTIYQYTSAVPTMYNSSFVSLGSGPTAPAAPNQVVRVDIPGEPQRLLLFYTGSNTIYSFDGTTYTTVTTNISLPTGAVTKIDLCGTKLLLATASTTWLLS